MVAVDAFTFTDFFNSYLKSISQIINAQSSTVNSILASISNSSLAEITDLTRKIDVQNQQLDKQITKVYSKSSEVKDVDTAYLTADLKIIKERNATLFYIYYIFIILAGIVICFKPTNLYMNLGILFVLAMYPFIVGYIERIIIFICNRIYKLFITNEVVSNIYIQDDY